MIKFIKKATSALLASIMCIPAGIVNITSAAQSNPDGSYTVTLTDTENGLIQFSEESMANSSASQDGYQMMHINDDGEMEQIENDGSLWAFKEGDTVEIECIPDDGYFVESLTLKDSESGNELAKKDTLNNVFCFTMPEKNVSVEAKFSSTVVIDINNGKSKSSDEIEYHDITKDIENEDLSISEQEINETVSDLISENYIKSHLNPKYVTVDSDDIRMANVLLVKNTLFDGQYVEENDTINSIMGSIEAGDKDMYKNALKFIAQLESSVVVYDFNASSDYYVAYANTLMKDSAYTVQDLCVAINSTEGIVVENGYVYDEETGLLYISKDLYKSENEKDKEIILYLQVQFMQVFNHKGRKSDSLTPDGIQAGTDIIADGASRNELTFVPESSSGTVRLSFDVPKWNSGVFVVYEELYVIANYDGTDHEILVAKHTDINDLNQTIYPNPVITTSLSDAGTKEKALDAKEDTTLTDTITYKNFDPRLSYTIRGQLINMETGHVLTDSKDRRVEAEKDVIPDSTGTGQWEMEYRFDASKLSGTSIVAFEEVYEHSENGTRLVASHKDFWDKEQRAVIPIIDTVALNPKTNGHIADAMVAVKCLMHRKMLGSIQPLFTNVTTVAWNSGIRQMLRTISMGNARKQLC